MRQGSTFALALWLLGCGQSASSPGDAAGGGQPSASGGSSSGSPATNGAGVAGVSEASFAGTGSAGSSPGFAGGGGVVAAVGGGESGGGVSGSGVAPGMGAAAGTGGALEPPKPVCPPGPYETPKAGAAKDICPGFQLKYGWSEGPTWVASQSAFFFSNFTIHEAGPGDTIRYDPVKDQCEVFIEGNACNGLAVDGAGNIVATCQGSRALVRYDVATKQSTVLVDTVNGKPLDSPNDLAIHPNGTIYFSNTTFELGNRPMGLGSALLRLDPHGEVQVIAQGSINPIGLSPDQKRLYAMGGYWELDEQGVPGNKSGAFTLGNDGIAVDCAGNVYTNGGAIVSPQNQTIGQYPAGTNQAFGGVNGKTLLVVNGKSVRTVEMNVPGLPY